jgi:ketosteroid isomerase-like protein
MTEKLAEDVVKFWSDYETTARTGKRAAETFKMLKFDSGATADPLASAWEMVTPHVADDYTFVDPYGAMAGKDHLETMIKGGTGVFTDFERTEHHVKVYGDTAIYVSLVTLRGQRNGEDVSGQYRETHTLLRREHGWLVIASQMTKVNPAHKHDK